MPEYKSDLGAWYPADEAAKEDCKQMGVEYRGVKRGYGGKTDTGVMAVGSTPRIAKDKFDGQAIAEPTPEQKKRVKKAE